jgi:DNA polymerase-3 subunit delta'
LLPLQALPAPKLGAVLDSIGLSPDQDEAALAELSGGSAGEAVRILTGDGLALYARIITLLGAAPKLNRGQVLALGSACAGPANARTYDLVIRLLDLALARLARHGAGHPPGAEAAKGERAVLARLSPGPKAARIWSDSAAMLSGRIAHARQVNLDPAQVILDVCLLAEGAARRALGAAE